MASIRYCWECDGINRSRYINVDKVATVSVADGNPSYGHSTVGIVTVYFDGGSDVTLVVSDPSPIPRRERAYGLCQELAEAITFGNSRKAQSLIGDLAVLGFEFNA